MDDKKLEKRAGLADRPDHEYRETDPLDLARKLEDGAWDNPLEALKELANRRPAD